MQKEMVAANYCVSTSNRIRRNTVQVQIGDLWLGSDYPIRVQSMTTTDTLDTAATVAQSIRMIDAGCELVRITAPSIKEAQNLENIKKELRAKGYNTPIVADIHYTPNAAELAARIVEKVRINPGNYADKKKFEYKSFSEGEYALELERIREKFLPLVRICKEYGTAMRIGSNHGSLSDRILSRYGDTPLGMVESALEFLRICEDENYHNIVISMKASNALVMMQAYRLLCLKLNQEGLKPYPLHLGVTEAGDGDDGRIKSASGIGALLADGLGDTVRVSLTEDPEFEMPVGRKLVQLFEDKPFEKLNPELSSQLFNPFEYKRRQTIECFNIGADNVPRVIADVSGLNIQSMAQLKSVGHHYLPALDKWALSDHGADFLYSANQPIPFMIANGSRQIVDYDVWANTEANSNALPLITIKHKNQALPEPLSSVANFVSIDAKHVCDGWHNGNDFNSAPIVFVLRFEQQFDLGIARLAIECINSLSIKFPIVLQLTAQISDYETQMLAISANVGSLLLDGLIDGLFIRPSADKMGDSDFIGKLNLLAFGILQASRARIFKTEYISCPSCGRTLFDLQETTAKIRKRTDHLKGVKIGIMGCIVNGPGEMADADYGYVGVGKDRIALYRGQNIIKKAVPADSAVDELIELIKEDGRWLEPSNSLV